MTPVQKVTKCPVCEGHGRLKTCPKCKGAGEIVVAIDGKPVPRKTKKPKK